LHRRISRGILQAGRPLRLRHYRIDHTRSNSYSAWVAAGRPQDPGRGQRAAIRARAGLEMCAPERLVDPALEDLTVSFELPLPGVSLLEYEAR